MDVSQATFEAEVVSYSKRTPVVVDFWAPWCGPCRTLGPLLERLAREARGAFRLAKLNVDENPELASRFGVQGIPSVKAFRDGQVVAEFVGAQPEPAVRKFLKQIAPNETDQALEQATGLLAMRRWSEAEALYRRVQALASDHPGARLGLVKALLAQGKAQEAERLLDHFPDSPEEAVAEKLSPLARLIVEASNGGQNDAHELDGLYHHAGQLAAQADFTAAMDELLKILRQDKRYRQGEPRQVMLALFELLGESDPLTREYRNKLASVLF